MAELENQRGAWTLTLLAIGYELLLTLSLLVETGGSLAIKHRIRLPAAYTGNLEEDLAKMASRLPGLLQVFLSLSAPVRLFFELLLPVLVWLVVVKVLLKLDGRRGWGWLVAGALAVVVPLEAAAHSLERSIQRQARFREAVESGAYQVTRSITFYERITPGLLLLVTVLIVLELLCTWLSVRYALNATEIVLPVFLLCFWGVLLQTAGGGLREAASFLLYTVLGLLACGAFTLLGALRLSRKGCYWLCGAMMALAVFTCVLGNLSPVNGSGAWVRILGVSVQTGELFKIFVVLFAAYAYPYLKMDRRLNLLFYITCAILCGALLMENDSGNMMILALLVAVVVLLDNALAGCILGLAALLGIPALLRFAAVYSTMENLPFAGTLAHISSRFSGMLTVLEDPQANPTFRATLLGLLKGGLLGTGVSESRSSFFPTYAACADYAFATILAVWGIVGALGVVLPLLLLLHNADVPFRYCRRSENYLAGKLATSVLAIQAAVHVGAALNLIPFLGTNFPFVSSGGSSMVSSWMLVGIILAARMGDEQARWIFERSRRVRESGALSKLKAVLNDAFSLKEEYDEEKVLQKLE